jgi:hypothetical protein
MSKTIYTDQEAAQIAVEYTRRRVAEIREELRKAHGKELFSKALVPPHKHTTGTTSSSGVEDVPPGKLNPPGKNDMLKGDKPEETTPRGEETTMVKEEELCKDCGKAHEMNKCGMTKAMLTDSKGRQIDNGIVPGSVLPGDEKSKKVNTSPASDPGSGGQIKKSVAEIRKAATPPMAKPPSGKNMGTHVPTSMNKNLQKNVGIFGRLASNKTGVTQALPKLKEAASGLHTVGGRAPLTTTKPSAPKPAGGQDSTAVLPSPAGATAAPSGTQALPGMAGNARAALNNTSAATKALAPRPALKPAGIGLATAGASKGNTLNDQTAQSLTVPAKPSNIK